VPAASAAYSRPELHPNFLAVLSLILLPILPFSKIRRRLQRNVWLVIVLAVSCFWAMSGCGGGGSSGGGSNAAPQSYSLTVSATAGALSHTSTVTLTIH
jgi:hypothetical protein